MVLKSAAAGVEMERISRYNFTNENEEWATRVTLWLNATTLIIQKTVESKPVMGHSENAHVLAAINHI
jgi:hypothetical protein